MDIYKVFYVIIFMSFFSSLVWLLIIVLEKLSKIHISYKVKLFSFIFAIYPICSNKIHFFDPEAAWVKEYIFVTKIWILGVICTTFFLLVKMLYLRHSIVKMSFCENERINQIYDSCFENSNCQKPRLLQDKSVDVAAAMGVYRKYIVCNLENIETLTDQEIRFIFLHELLHHRNYQIFFIHFIDCIGVLYWFNPVFIYYKKYFMLCCEEECDTQLVTSVTKKEKTTYANLLWKLSDKNVKQCNQMTSYISKRIRNLLQIQSKMKLLIIRFIFTIGIVLIVFISVKYSERCFYPYPSLMYSTERAR